MAVSDWSTNAANNGNTLGVNIAEQCASANLNNALREAMAQIAAWYNVAQPLIATIASKLTSTSAASALAGVTPGADKIPYFTDGVTADVATLTSFIRTLLDDTDATAACNTLGAVRVAALSLANPGYAKFQVGAAPLYFQVAWGSATFNAGSTSINYAAAFPNASFAVVSAAALVTNNNNPGVTATTVNGFTTYSALPGSIGGFYIAVGY